PCIVIYIYTLSLHDALPIFYEKGPDIQNKEIAEFIENIKQNVKPEDYIIFSGSLPSGMDSNFYMDIISLLQNKNAKCILDTSGEDRKSTRLNSSHVSISYAV